MAAKKKSSAQSVLAVIAVVVVAYFGYRLIFGRKVSAATTPGVYPSGGGAASYYGANPYANQYPYGYQYGYSGQMNPIMQLLNKLLGFGSKNGSSGSRGSSGGSGSSGTGKSGSSSNSLFDQGAQWDASGNALENVIESAWNNNPDLGGEDLYSYSPDNATDSGLSSYQIPEPGYNPADYDLPLTGSDLLGTGSTYDNGIDLNWQGVSSPDQDYIPAEADYADVMSYGSDDGIGDD